METGSSQRAAILSVRGASKRYGRTQALAGVDLDLRRGEWLGLLGPNGAGKTTLVKAISGRVKLDAGTVRMNGRELTNGGRDAAEARARLGIVPQEVALYPLLTARENLEIFASLSGLTGSVWGERVDWALEFTGLRDRADSLVRTFSGGMKRRLNMGCSVMHRPEVILLDEPTVGVDPQSRERIWSMLGDLRSEGASLLLTSHQLDEVERVCERIVIIDHGSVIADGSLDALIASTVGRGRRVTMTLDQQVEGEAIGPDAEIDGRNVVCHVDDVAAQLPDLLSRVSRTGRSIEDVHIEHPTLQSVFIHLTGRALRE